MARQIALHRFGGPEVLETVQTADSPPAPGEIRRVFNQVIALNPLHLNAYLGLAECFGALGMHQEYLELTRNAGEIFPTEGFVFFRLKEVFELSGQLVGKTDRSSP